MRARGMPSRERKSNVGCDPRPGASGDGGGFERGPGASEFGRVQACAPPRGGGGVGSPTTIIREPCTAALAAFGVSLAGRATGFGGGASLRPCASFPVVGSTADIDGNPGAFGICGAVRFSAAAPGVS